MRALSVLHVHPDAIVIFVEVGKEPKMEKREVVYQLKHGTMRFPAGHAVTPNETAFDKFGQCFPERAVVRKSRRTKKLEITSVCLTYKICLTYAPSPINSDKFGRCTQKCIFKNTCFYSTTN